VSEASPPGQDRVRTAEVVAALSLATDLGIGVELEHGLHATVIAMRLGDRLGIDVETASQTFYATLLAHIGCTADAEVGAEIFGTDTATHVLPSLFGSRTEMMVAILRTLPTPGSNPVARAAQIARRLPKAAAHNRVHLATVCEVGRMLTGRLGLPDSVQQLFANITERWDGKGFPGRARGEAIPMAMRITHVARDAALQQTLGGLERAATVVHRGPMDGCLPTYQALARWIEHAGYRNAGPNREVTLACPEDPAGMVTELQEPVTGG